MLQDSEKQDTNYFLLQQTYQEALHKNGEAEEHWRKLKKGYEIVESLLSDLPKQLSCEVMVPVGPKAFMPGKIVHTNEILVSLGQGYFVKRSVSQATEISRRRSEVCSDMLSSLGKERELLLARSELPFREDAFRSGQEIFEPYSEEEEANWRVEHRKREKGYRQKLAEMKRKEKTHIDDEDSLWKRLDELELQEELEEELDRLHAGSEEDDINDDDDDDDDEDDDDNEDESVVEDFVETLVPGKNGLIQKRESVQTANAVDLSSSHSSRRVSFANSCEESLSESESEETLRIEFKHSSCRTQLEKTVGCILTPGDIYTYFKDQFLSEPKSILKKTASTEGGADNIHAPVDIEEYERRGQNSLPPVLHDVAEHDEATCTEIQNQQVTQRISRFKASRLRSKQ